MKKIVPFIALLVLIIFTFSVPGFAAEEPDVKTALLELQRFTEEQNDELLQRLELMMSFLGQDSSYNQVQKIKKAILALLEDSKRNTEGAGEILKKERLEKKDIVMFIDKIKLSIVALSVVNYTYAIILSKEKEKIDKILEKLKKEKDNKST